MLFIYIHLDSQVLFFFSPQYWESYHFSLPFLALYHWYVIWLFLHSLFTLLGFPGGSDIITCKKSSIFISAFPVFILYFLFILSYNLFYYDF